MVIEYNKRGEVAPFCWSNLFNKSRDKGFGGVSFHEEWENVERRGVLSARTRKNPQNGLTKRFFDA